MEKVVLVIDGERYAVPRGMRLVTVLNHLSKGIPQVCYHDALGPIQTCDSCLVEVDGELRRSCATEVEGELQVDTDTPRASAAREEAIHRILANHELYCTICDFNNGGCEVHNATELVQLKHQKYPFERKPYEVDESNPFYRYDPDQCILCGRCVEACQNVQVTETLSIDWEAEHPRVLWDGGRKINESSCVSCGHCVTVCPCNALMEKSMLGRAGYFTGAPEPVRRKSIDLVKYTEKYTGFAPLMLTSNAEAKMREATVKKTKTVCTYCGVGCAFDVWTRDRTILKVEPTSEAPANGISTCIKGKFGWGFVNSPDRLTKPLVREDGRFREASWDEALTRVARGLREVEAKHGRDALGFIASSKTTNEEAYLIQKIARAIFLTNNVDNCARYCQSPATKGLARTVGYGGDSGTMNDIELADLVVIIGSHTATSHPVLASRIKRRQKLHGQKLIVADLLEHEMAKRADIFVRPRQGTDLVWINAVAREILARGWEDRAFIEARVNKLDAYRESLERYTIEYAEEVTGVPAATLRQLAEEIGKTPRVCILWAMGVTQRINGSDTSTAISNLLLLTGNYGRPGTGGYPLRGHNNVQGTSDFGAMNDKLPGYVDYPDEEGRRAFEEEWGVPISTEPGLNNTTMVTAAHEGKLKGLFVMGEELALADSNLSFVHEALERLELFVVQDIFFSTTAQFADVVLPGAPSFEKDGTFVNTERRIQRLYEVLPPLGDSRPDWQILTDVARYLGHDWGYTHPSQIMDEVARTTKLFRGVSYERLEGYRSLCWPVREDGQDEPLLYRERFHFPDGKANFDPVQWTPPSEDIDAAYDLYVNNGRVLEHFHEGNLTYRTPGMRQKVDGTFVEVSPELARERQLADGDWVRLVSRRGAVKIQVVVSSAVQGKELYMPLCSSTEAVNFLTSSEKDPAVDTPAYKEVAVRLEKLDGRGPSPMPRTNPRFGEPTPRRGVEVERKWARPDYRPPPLDRRKGGRV